MTKERIDLGQQGEGLARVYLQQQGYTIISNNYKSRFGEIDIIAQKNECIAFVEVKLRRDPRFELSQLITYSKMKKIHKTAQYFILENCFFNKIYRFDVILIDFQGNDYIISYIENAFCLGD